MITFFYSLAKQLTKLLTDFNEAFYLVRTHQGDAENFKFLLYFDF